MRLNHLPLILGLTTVAVFSTQLSAKAETENYKLGSGTTNLSINAGALDTLRSLGLSFDSAKDTVTPASGFSFGFGILPPSSDLSVLGTDFSFSYDTATSAFTPLSGTIEHVGSLLFNVDTNKLALFSPLEIGNFSIGFDGGFFIRDTASTGLRLFDLAVKSNPVLDGKNLLVSNVDVLLSREFADVLTNYADPALSAQLAGTVIGQAQINAETVPEPSSVLAILTAASAAMGLSRRRKVAQ
jgi:hypothetical protein